MTLLFPAKFGDEYPVEHRGYAGKTASLKFDNAVVRGIKITPYGTEVTLLVPVGQPDAAPEPKA